MQNFTTAELTDIAVFSIAQSLLNDDRTGVFVNDEITAKVDNITERMNVVTNFYKQDARTKKRICTILSRLENAVRARGGEIQTTATQCAFEIVRTLCCPSERKGRVINERLRTFWAQNEKDIMTVLYAAADVGGAYEDYAIDSESLAYFLRSLI